MEGLKEVAVWVWICVYWDGHIQWIETNFWVWGGYAERSYGREIDLNCCRSIGRVDTSMWEEDSKQKEEEFMIRISYEKYGNK